jgi:outer membrane biosynthesis protein TonB
MKNIILLIALIFISALGSGQRTERGSGTVDENFVGGKAEYYNSFRSKLKYPDELRGKKIFGNVSYELLIDTNGTVAEIKIIKSPSELFDKEIKDKIYLTNGKWTPIYRDGKKIPYRIREVVYFEVR